ncbi:DUF3024 domain-containing protein [Streptomyces sp. NPDC057909]|uniref:DUF3024 domain-containing protein n=1 Tax=Streptomyces sp. NPDC057909 TaxID=3346277 RepID=UPI0036E66080
MKISETDRARLAQWADQHVPAHARHEVRVACTVRGSTAVISEERAPWDGTGDWTSRRIARLRHTDNGWLLDGADRNGRWYPYDHVPATPSLDTALTTLDDPRHAFWG